MKIKLNSKQVVVLGVICLAASNFSALGATYTVTGSNISDIASDTAIVDNTGALLSEGSNIAAIGYFRTFTDGNVAAQSLGSLGGDFEVLASNNFNTTALLGGNVAGFYNINTDIADAETDAAVIAGSGRTLYLFFANNTDLGLANQIGLVQTTASVIADFSGTPPFQSEANLPGTTIVGNSGLSVLIDFLGDPVNSQSSFQLVAVPEPSSTALLGLGGLALILRRRR